MSNRWQMNRMGFVNFWLYDDETFEFADGCLLLRGANASGKSITTQSMIPFILDGDRSPSRLDPFGSADRKMEYYFLGNGGRDDVTGYLFLEFKKRGLEQYRTIGIGQRAQKGKPMDFWGFIILDNRRIGKDISLYKDVGDRKIPHTKQILKNILGEANPFVSRQREYMELVNKYLFAFPRIEQYEQFIQLMIKVRAPKLSRDFKPSKVYEILNDSLQTLADTDLRPMVEAMEKMDDIQNRLEGLKSAQKELAAVKREYDRYTAYVLAQKAKNYLQTYERTQELQAKLEEYRRQDDENIREIGAIQKENDEAALQSNILQRERSLLDLTDIRESVDKLAVLKGKQAELEKQAQAVNAKISKCEDDLKQYEASLRKQEQKVEESRSKAEETYTRMSDYNASLSFDGHEGLQAVLPGKELSREMLEQERDHLLQDAERALRDLASQVQLGINALQDAARLEKEVSRRTEALDQKRQQRDAYACRLDEAERVETEYRDTLIEAFFALDGALKEFPLTKEDINDITHMVSAYRGAQDIDTFNDMIQQRRDWRKDELSREQAEQTAALRDCRKKIKDINLALDELHNTTEAEPIRKESVCQARKLLADAGVAARPFYECVEYAADLTKEQQALLEAQITDAGLLDALLVPAEEYARARSLLQDAADVLIDIPADRPAQPLQMLIPAHGNGVLDRRAADFLSHIGIADDGTAALVLSPDGYYRHGILEGHSLAAPEALYIGRQARQAALARKIEALEKERAQWQAEESVYSEAIRRLDDSVSQLSEEYRSLPSFGDLNQAIALVAEEQFKLSKVQADYEAVEAEVRRLQQEKKEQDQVVLRICKPLPYLRTIEEYGRVHEDIRLYDNTLRDLERWLHAWSSQWEQKINIQDKIQFQEIRRDEAFDALQELRFSLRAGKAEIEKLEDMVNSPENKEKAARFQEITAALTQWDITVRRNGETLARLDERCRSNRETIEALKDELGETQQRQETASMYWQEEISLMTQEQEEGLPDRLGKSLLQLAGQARDTLPDNLKNKTIGDMATSLSRVFQQHSSALVSYGTALEDYFDEDASGYEFLRRRVRVSSSWQGKKIYLSGFSRLLTETISDTELLIQEKDRELFENILADTLSRKLSNRIAESKKWIADMSELMLHMDTSMGLNFSLSWRPCHRETIEELDVAELEKLLSRDAELLTQADIDRLARHFRNKIKLAREQAEEREEPVNYADLVRSALDYRKWYEFCMYLHRPDTAKRELTNSAFNKFSGGEKAMAMYVPLFAAVNAQYRKSDNDEHPRVIALDEAFAGVDDQNISSMFALVQQLDLDYIMNSQSLWGCYDVVKKLKIVELLRPANSSTVSVINCLWNGRKRVLV